MSQVAAAYPYGFRAGAFTGVRTRRLFAWVIDAIIVGLLTSVTWAVLLIATLGLSWFLLPPLFPAIAVLYHALTVSGSGRGTVGMRTFDLEVAMYESGGRAPFVNAAAQSILFYISWALPLIFVVTLVDNEKRYLHDILSSLVVLRRNP
jgi:uncharacterized RDD family membrane protein YckC